MELAVIFDMNGVIVDDMPYHRQAWCEFYKRRGKPFTEDDFNRECNGRTNAEILELLLGRAPQGDELNELEDEKESLYRDLFRAHRTLTPGLLELLRSLQQNHIPVAVATSAPPSNVGFVLDELDIRQFFAAVIDATQVRRGKPHPEIYLTAASRLRKQPARCVVFEDSLQGIRAAKAAGMRVIALTTTHTASELQEADDFITDFSGTSLEAITNLMR